MNQQYAEFISKLLLEQEAIKTFTELLQNEQNIIAQGNIDGLDSITSDKMRIVEQLGIFDEQRNHYLVSQGLSPNVEGMNKLLSAEAPNSEVSTIWIGLLLLAKFARQLNQINGTMITARLQHAQQAFSALRCAAGTIALYGPKGQTLSY